MPQRRRLVIVSSMVVPALFALPLPVAAATTPGLGRAGQAAAPMASGSNDFLNSDSCISGRFCMAVGDSTADGHASAMAQRWNGSKWIPESVPSPAHGANVFANGVSCAASTRCMFVGDHRAAKGAASDLAEAWSGSAWQIVPDTGPAHSGFSGLNDVACPYSSFCLAVGLAGRGKTNQGTAFIWRNRKTWRQVPVPHPSQARTSELGAVACGDGANCMAVGSYTTAAGQDLPFAARWHEGRWVLLTVPAASGQKFTSLQGVSCGTITSCVAVGHTEDKSRKKLFHAVAETWNGDKWRVSMLRREPSLFIGVSCPSPTHCFASGDTFPAALNAARPLIEFWNGRTWTNQDAAQTFRPRNGNVLQHVSCATRLRCEAVGFRYDPGVSNSDQTLAEMWNGNTWTVQGTANP